MAKAKKPRIKNTPPSNLFTSEIKLMIKLFVTMKNILNNSCSIL